MPTRKASAVAQLLSLAVHEFRTPASVVSGYLRMLQRDVESPLTASQLKMVEEAEKSCTRLVALVAELSEVSKLDAGLTTLAQDPVDLFRMVEDVATGVHEAADRGVTLEVRGEGSGASLIGDGPRLRAALSAVFRAVLREQPGSCTVVADRRVDTRDGRRSAVIIVAEQMGVQPAYQSKAKPFDEKRGGLGLALPIARRVIEGHGGRLWSPAGASERGAALVSLPLSELNR